MSRTFIFDGKSSVTWPQKCAVCCEEYDRIHVAKARSASVPAFQPWIWAGLVKYQNLAMSFPVCRKHKRISLLFSIAQFSALIIAVGSLIGVARADPGSTAALAWLGAMVAGAIALYLAIVRFPIRVGMEGDKALVITILNQRYADEFERTNRDTLKAYAELAARGMG
jgi:hypothetical protein